MTSPRPPAQPFQPGILHVRIEGQSSVFVKVYVDRMGVVILVATGCHEHFITLQAHGHRMPDPQGHAHAETSVGVEGAQILRLDHRLHGSHPEDRRTVTARIKGLAGVVVAGEVGPYAPFAQRQLLRQRIGNIARDFVGVLHEGTDPHLRLRLVERGDRLPEWRK